MTTLREAAQQALEALDSIDVGYRSPNGNPLEVSFDEEKCEAAITALRAALAQPNTAQQVVDEQAEDEGLWFVAQTAAEAYLQQALRRLHAAVEGEK